MKYTEKRKIEYNECDECGQLKLTAMMDLLMQVSEHQLQLAKASASDLVGRGLGWVVTQYHIEVKRLPKPLEEVVIGTEAIGYNRFLAYRDFWIADQAGEKLITVNSQWVLFDLEKRKMVPTDETLMQNIKAPLLKKMPRFPRLRPLEQYDRGQTYRVTYYDLDTNHHLTNSHYFNWLIDLLDREFLHQYTVKTIDLKFDQELKYGMCPESLIKLEQQDQIVISHHVIKNDANEAAVCRIEWQNLDKE